MFHLCFNCTPVKTVTKDPARCTPPVLGLEGCSSSSEFLLRSWSIQLQGRMSACPFWKSWLSLILKNIQIPKRTCQCLLFHLVCVAWFLWLHCVGLLLVVFIWSKSRASAHLLPCPDTAPEKFKALKMMLYLFYFLDYLLTAVFVGELLPEM